MSKQDTSGAHGSAAPPNKNNSQETFESSNKLRFTLLFISIITSLLVAPFFLTDNIFKICIFFATFTILIFALTDLIIYLSKEPPHPTITHINSIENENKKTNKNSLSIVVKKVVHHAQQYRVAVSRFMRSIFRTKWLTRTFTIALSFPVSLTLAEHWKEIAGKITAVLEFFIVDNKPLGVSILITTLVILIVFFKNIVSIFQKITASLTSKYFVFTLASLAIIGALSALLIPSYTSWFREPGYTSAQQESAKETPEKAQNTPSPTPSSTDNKAAEVEQKSTSDLRLHLLYITGGIIAILGLIETNRKNSQDHIRQVHAARRNRYIEAVDKLSSKQAPVRLGGVYALIGLIDEWLNDDNITKETQIKEGQIIINNLCSYIRSPFALAAKAKDFETNKVPNVRNKKAYFEDRMRFHEEKDVRRTILAEIVNHIRTPDTSHELKNYNHESDSSSENWKKFIFDFTKAPIFYELNTLTYETLKFEGVVFYIKPDFTGAIFNSSTSFQSCHFTRGASFQRTRFQGLTDFSFTHFDEEADFSWSEFSIYTTFKSACFSKNSSFSVARFNGPANFIGTRFKAKTDFSMAFFKSATFFSHARFKKAKFMMTNFGLDVNFKSAYFKKGVSFLASTFAGNADFEGAHFRKYLTFIKAEFKGNINFSNTVFDTRSPLFSIPQYPIESCTIFSYLVDPQNYIFNVSPKSHFSIMTKKIIVADGRIFSIPIGCMLFDPGSWDEEKQEYTRVSKPAK